MRALACAVGAGVPLAAALRRWANEVPSDLRPHAARVARRVALGQDPAGALAAAERVLHPAGPLVASAVAAHDEAGGDLEAILGGVSDALGREEELRAKTRAATAGVRASARVVAALPLAVLPLAVLAGAPLFDAGGATAAVLGMAAAVAGLGWMDRLVPVPPASDGYAFVAEVAAALMRAGLDRDVALRVAIRCAPPDAADDLRRARRLASMGASWGVALAAGGPAAAELGEAVGRVEVHGGPLTGELRRVARRRREARARDFDGRLRRAPVAMLVPLTLCVLPAYLLLVGVPLLRALAL